MEPTNEQVADGSLASKALATLIIDALVCAKLIGPKDTERAIAIAAEEIDARKAVGDY